MAHRLKDEIRAAVEQTVAARTARVFSVVRRTSLAPSDDDVDRCEGVVAFTRRLTRVTTRSFTAGFMQQVVRDTSEPLRDASEDQARLGVRRFIEAMAGEQVTLHVGGAVYAQVENGWADFVHADIDGPRLTRDPLWVLDALAGVRDDVDELEHEAVRGISTRRL